MTSMLATLLLILACVLPSEGAAQAEPRAPAGTQGVRLYVGMWTTHLAHVSRGLEANWLLGVGWRGYFGGTFVNSFGGRGFALAIERSVVRADEGRVVRGLGYRLGLVTGYDERLVGLAGLTPVLPAFQLTGDVAVGRTGLELAWTGKVATMSPFMRVGR
jgi:hypothetical protein